MQCHTGSLRIDASGGNRTPNLPVKGRLLCQVELRMPSYEHLRDQRFAGFIAASFLFKNTRGRSRTHDPPGRNGTL